MMPERSAWRFRPGDDGSGRDRLPPKNPRCGECPLRAHCAAFASGTPEAFPERRRRAERPHRYGVAYWIERDGHVWLVRRPAEGPARRNGGAARRRMGPLRSPAPAASRRCATSSPISRSILPSCRRSEPLRRRLVAAARPAFGSRPADALPARCRACPRFTTAGPRGGLKKARVALKSAANPFHLAFPRKQGNFMDDRFNTIAGWVLFAGIVALGSSIVASEVFHSRTAGKDGLSDRRRRPGRRGRGRRRAADRGLSRQSRSGEGPAGLQQVHGLPQCRQGRRQPAWPEPVGRDRRADRAGQGLRLLRRAGQARRHLELGQSCAVAQQPEGVRAGHQDDLRGPQQSAGSRRRHRLPQRA